MEQQQKNSIDDKPLTFGKYRGKTPNEVYEINPGYIVWMMDNFKDGVPCTPCLMQLAKEKHDEETESEWECPYTDMYMGMTYGDTC